MLILNEFEDKRLSTRSRIQLGSAERVPGCLSHILHNKSLSLSLTSIPKAKTKGHREQSNKRKRLKLLN